MMCPWVWNGPNQISALTRQCVNPCQSGCPIPPGCGRLAELAINCAACCGEAVCGDFGSAAQQRYMHLGGVSPLVVAVERVALQWEARVLVDTRVHADVDTNWNCRLYGPVIYAKRGAPQPHLQPEQSKQPLLLWAVCGEKEAGQNSGH